MRFLKDNALVAIISAVTVILLLIVLRDIVFSAIVASTVAIVSYPLFKRIDGRIRNASASAGLVTAMVAAVFLIALVLPAYVIYANRGEIISYIEYGENIISQLPVNTSEVKYEITDQAKEAGVAMVRNIPKIVLNISVFFIMLFLLLRYSNQILHNSEKFLSQYAKTRYLVNKMYDKLYDTLFMVYVSNIIIAGAVFVLSIPMFWILGYDKFIFLSLLAGIFELLPILGPVIIIAAVALHQYLIGNILGLMIALIYGSIVVGLLPDYVLRSFIIGRKAEISEVLILVSIIGGILTMGAWGVIFGPIIVVLSKTVIEFILDEKPRNLKPFG